MLYLKFKGSMTFPLAGAETKEYFDSTTVFTGDFKSPTKRKLILNQPRKYQLLVVLKHINGVDEDITEYDIEERLSHANLASVLKQLIREQANEADPSLVDLTKSTVTITLKN